MAELEATIQPVVAELRRLGAGCDVRVDLEADHVRYYDVQVQEFYSVENFIATIQMIGGTLDVAYAGGLNSGSLRRRYVSDLSADVPQVHYIGVMDELEAHENLRPQIAYTFPGNTVTGLFSRTEDLTMTLEAKLANGADYRYPMHEVGTSDAIAIEGIAEGQAGPEFMTNIYPGLKTKQYPYERMTAFSEHLADGTVVSDMVFNGDEYDTYMEGTVDPNHLGEFEIGVILMSEKQDPEWNHEYKQGRVPVLMFEGRIEDGAMVDVEVAYPWPNEAMYSMFLRNNYFYRSWKVKQAQKALAAEETDDGS
jgi:hypothetical protein